MFSKLALNASFKGKGFGSLPTTDPLTPYHYNEYFQWVLETVHTKDWEHEVCTNHRQVPELLFTEGGNTAQNTGPLCLISSFVEEDTYN